MKDTTIQTLLGTLYMALIAVALLGVFFVTITIVELKQEVAWKDKQVAYLQQCVKDNGCKQ